MALARDVVCVTAAAEESLRAGGAAIEIDRSGMFERPTATVSAINAPLGRSRVNRVGVRPSTGLARPALVEEASK